VRPGANSKPPAPAQPETGQGGLGLALAQGLGGAEAGVSSTSKSARDPPTVPPPPPAPPPPPPRNPPRAFPSIIAGTAAVRTEVATPGTKRIQLRDMEAAIEALQVAQCCLWPGNQPGIGRGGAARRGAKASAASRSVRLRSRIEIGEIADATAAGFTGDLQLPRRGLRGAPFKSRSREIFGGESSSSEGIHPSTTESGSRLQPAAGTFMRNRERRPADGDQDAPIKGRQRDRRQGPASAMI